MSSKSFNRHLRARYLRLSRWRQRLTPSVLWDGFMVYLALLNVGLILFDLSYFWLRPQYFNYLPALTEIYDPVKGIEPHPLTTRYVEAVAELAANADDDDVETRAALYAELRDLSAGMLDDDPFDRSGQSHNMRSLKQRTQTWVADRGDMWVDDLTVAEAFDRLWSEGTYLGAAVAFFNSELRPLMKVNYDRQYSLDGRFVDGFWLLDLPFLLIFAVEFLTRWILAIHRRRYPKWYLFPIFNWYDVLGLIPVRELRVFRLFRVASIYVRLYKSERTTIGDDVVSRTARYFYNIINEEISDMVSLRILSETQEEIRSGTHRRIIRAVAGPRRDTIARELTLRMRDVLVSTDARNRLRAFLNANLKRSVESAVVLRRLPLPKAVVRPLVEVIGEIIFDAILETMAATLETEEGRETLNDVLAATIEGIVEELTVGQVEELVREIAIDAIEHIKTAVKVRKWVEAETPIEQQILEDRSLEDWSLADSPEEDDQVVEDEMEDDEDAWTEEDEVMDEEDDGAEEDDEETLDQVPARA